MKLCDFLSVDLAAETVTEECNGKAEVKSVERGGYHVVIFCLLLEYLPRYIFIQIFIRMYHNVPSCFFIAIICPKEYDSK